MQTISEYGRNVGIGMEGTRLKLTMNIQRKQQKEWLEQLKVMVEKLQHARKETVASS